MVFQKPTGHALFCCQLSKNKLGVRRRMSILILRTRILMMRRMIEDPTGGAGTHGASTSGGYIQREYVLVVILILLRLCDY
ncbi:hypothetical protein FRX31_026173 [Thalictrum thalictroides]|uniref:Uncharacterized protein n=1 Tax=Thalictrum thalictroides TaxID=46969 RepID=A0A7J6VHJ9_THATH|nr:hypothetical protein FRX31_026173 [Thalictrum thalictroides]